MTKHLDSRPVWLLDVDGVLNANRPGWGAAPRKAHVYVEGQEYRMRWAPTLIYKIRRMCATGNVDIRWCTTWCPHVNQLERIWQLPPLDRALLGDHVPGGSAGDVLKLTAAREVLGEGRPLIWTDDTAVPSFGPLYDGLMSAGRACLIRPNPSTGLQPHHLEAIELFIVKSENSCDKVDV